MYETFEATKQPETASMKRTREILAEFATSDTVAKPRLSDPNEAQGFADIDNDHLTVLTGLIGDQRENLDGLNEIPVDRRTRKQRERLQTGLSNSIGYTQSRIDEVKGTSK